MVVSFYIFVMGCAQLCRSAQLGFVGEGAQSARCFMVRLRNADPLLCAYPAQTKERRLVTSQERSTVLCYTTSPSAGIVAWLRPEWPWTRLSLYMRGAYSLILCQLLSFPESFFPFFLRSSVSHSFIIFQDLIFTTIFSLFITFVYLIQGIREKEERRLSDYVKCFIRS